MEPIRVVLADFDPAQVERMSAFLRDEPDIVVTGATVRADEVLSLLRQSGAAVLVTNLQLVGGDGLLLLKHLAEDGRLRVRTVICSHFTSPHLVARAAELGACGYLEQPCSPEALREYVRLAGAEVPALALGEQFLSLRTARLLRELGLVPGRRGFVYLRHAVCLWVRTGEDCTGITKEIYPAVASACHTTSAAVERCIRQTIRRLWSEPATPCRLRLFPAEGMLSRAYPTNVQFVGTVAGYLNRTWGAEVSNRENWR